LNASKIKIKKEINLISLIIGIFLVMSHKQTFNDFVFFFDFFEDFRKKTSLFNFTSHKFARYTITIHYITFDIQFILITLITTTLFAPF
jgi:hypothetical protein